MQRAWVLVVITALLAYMMLATGFPFFTRMVYIFGILLVVGFAWAWLLAQGVEVEARRPALRTRAGQAIVERVLVRRRNRLLRGFVEVRETTDMRIKAPGAVVGMEGRDQESINLTIPCPERGIFTLGPLRAEASDPLGLFRLRKSAGEAQRLVVHPATIELPGFVLLPADLPGEGRIHLRSQTVTNSAYSVRDYVYGDSLNRIAWKPSAHHQKLLVKEFEMEPANNIWVLADLERHANQGPAGRAIEETVVTVSASIAKRYIDGGYPVGFFAYGNERFALAPQRGPGHLLRIFDALAELRALGTTNLLDVIAALQSRTGRYTSIAIVTPARDSEWLDGVRHLMMRRSRVAVVCVDGETASRDTLPATVRQVAAMGVPAYTVRAGTEQTTGLTAISAPTAYESPVAQAARIPMG